MPRYFVNSYFWYPVLGVVLGLVLLSLASCGSTQVKIESSADAYAFALGQIRAADRTITVLVNAGVMTSTEATQYANRVDEVRAKVKQARVLIDLGKPKEAGDILSTVNEVLLALLVELQSRQPATPNPTKGVVS